VRRFTSNAARKFTTEILVGQWILIGVLTLAIFLAYTEYRNLVNCVNEYVHNSQAAQQARAEAATKNDLAVDRMVEDVLLAQSDVETRQALERYKQTRAEVIKTQKQNPVPTPPDHC
jgi:uncharacterized membrane protein